MRILLCLFLLVPLGLRAANPSFNDFNTNQFGVTGNKVAIKSGLPITNLSLIGFPTGDASMLTNKEPIALRSFYNGIGLSLQKTTNRSVVAWIGDSWAAGWYDQLREKMRQQYGYGGDGYWPVTTNSANLGYGLFSQYSSAAVLETAGAVGWSLAGVWTNDFAGSGPNLITATTHDLTAGINWTSRVTRFSIIYKVQTGGGTFTYSQDGGGAVAVNTSTGTDGLFTNIFTPTLTYGLHTLAIAITDIGTTGVTIAGIDLQAEGYGPRLHALGAGSTGSTNWVNVTSNVWVSALRTLNPDTVFVSLGGVNDKTWNVPIATYRANMDLVEKRLTAALPTADIVYVSQAETASTTTTHTVADYLAVQREIALTNRHDFINNYDLFGVFSVSTNMGLWVDTIHPSIVGNKSLFMRLVNFLGDRGANYGSLSIHPRYNHAGDKSEISIGGDTNTHWIRTDRGTSLPMQMITGVGGVPKTNMVFETDGTTTVRSFNGNIGIGVDPPTALFDARGNFKFIGSKAGSSTFGTIQATDMTTGNSVLNMAGGTVTGNLIGIDSSATISGIYYHQIRNLGAGSALNQLWAGSAGDAYQVFLNTNSWSVGNDYSAGKFAISLGSVLGTGDAFTIDANKNIATFGTSSQIGALGASTALSLIQGTDLASGDVVINVAGNAVTGSVIGLQEQVSCSVLFYNNLRNTGAGGALQIIQAGTTGDAYTRYITSSGADWAVGGDFSDATKFKVSFGGTLGTADRFTLTTNGNATITGNVTVLGTTNQVIFGSTNTAPVSVVAPTKWISVQVTGDAGVYRLPLYE
jgi:hypothetical protein